jgi:hypothetical protein
MKYLIYLIPLCLTVLPHTSLAGLVVDFESAPLFAEANVLPGDAVARTITVTNTGSESEMVEFTFENVIPGLLAEEMELAVRDEGALYVLNTFEALFAGGPYSLGTVSAGSAREYTFTAGFPTSAGNPLQNESFGFDIRIGFVGEASVTDRSVSRSGGRRNLELFNESVVVEEDFGGAFVTWDSNRPATTYLVCGNVENGPFSLTEDAPLFGYEFALTEITDTVTVHGQAVTGLEPGAYECRPAGREALDDAFTVGDPVQFTLTGPAGEVAGVSISLTDDDIYEYLQSIIDNRPRGTVLGVSGKGVGNMTYEEYRAEMDAFMAERVTTTEASPAINPELLTEPTEQGSEGVDSGAEPDTPDAPTGFPWWGILFGVLVVVLAGLFIRARG